MCLCARVCTSTCVSVCALTPILLELRIPEPEAGPAPLLPTPHPPCLQRGRCPGTLVSAEKRTSKVRTAAQQPVNVSPTTPLAAEPARISSDHPSLWDRAHASEGPATWPEPQFPHPPSKSDSFMKVLGPAGGSRHSQPLAGLQYGKPSNEKKTEVAETSRPAEVTQASGLGHEWALSWDGHRTRAWGGDRRARPKEWQCPGQARGREEMDSGLQPRPRGLWAQPPPLPRPGRPPNTQPGYRKGAGRPLSKCRCRCFPPITVSPRASYKFTFCSGRSFIWSLRARPRL